MKRWALTFGAVVSLAGSACVEMGQVQVEIPLSVAGTATPKVRGQGEVELELFSAQLAFGPLYLCPGVSAGDLCETARAEWLQSTVVDLLSPQPREVGKIAGTSGVVQSWMYDLGLSSQLSQSKPAVLDAAKRLGGYSLVLRGRAVIDGLTLPFSASVAAQQSEDTEIGVPVVRKSLSDPFFRDLGVGKDALLVRFDPGVLLASLDLRSYVERKQCAEGAPTILCDGTLQRTCEESTEVSVVDCAAANQVCIAGQGCASELVLQPDTVAYRALRTALLSGARPHMQWVEPSPGLAPTSQSYLATSKENSL